MKKTLTILGILLMANIVFGDTTDKKINIPEEIRKAYTVTKQDKQVMTLFKISLDVKFKNSSQLSAFMIRGFDLAFEQGEKGFVLGAGVLFKDNTMTAFYTTFDDLSALKKKELSPVDFSKRIKIKSFDLGKGKKE